MIPIEERTDTTLVTLARSGDKQAFGELIERYQLMAQMFTLRLVGNLDVAREVIQEAMLQAYLSLDHLRDDTRFKGWFYGIVLNVSRSKLREQKRSALSLEAMLTGLSSSAIHFQCSVTDPQEVLEEHELQQLMQEAMNLLSPKNRTVTFLFYYEQLSLQEIADQLGISVVAVKSRLHQARKELREQLLIAYPELQATMPGERKRKKMIKVTIAEVLQQDQYSVVVLHDQVGKRALAVWIGYWEAEAIAIYLAKKATPKALTFNFMAQLLSASGSSIEEIRVESLKDETFYAVARIRHNNAIQEVEARPSDALALAVYTNSTVYVVDEVMEQAGIDLLTVNGKLTQQDLDMIVSKLKEKKPISGLTTFGSESPNHPRNFDFADGTTGWFMAGSRPQNYEWGIDRGVKGSGSVCAHLKSKISESGGVFGTLMQMFNAKDYQNKRVRLSGYIKSESVDPWAGFWMRVDDVNGTVLSFDNMQDRPVFGSIDWQKFDVVLNVPENGFNIAFGILLAGKGQGWFGELRLVAVEQSVPTTDLEASSIPRNLNFTQGTTGWFLNGSHPQNYEQGIDHSIKWNDELSVYLKNKVAEPAGFGAFMQIMRADAYQDKQVKLSGFVKTEAVEGYAGLCLCYDNQSMVATLKSIPSTIIAGTRDWQKFEIVADIPESSNSIGFGFMLSGNGQVWLSNIHFESVDRMVTA